MSNFLFVTQLHICERGNAYAQLRDNATEGCRAFLGIMDVGLGLESVAINLDKFRVSSIELRESVLRTQISNTKLQIISKFKICKLYYVPLSFPRLYPAQFSLFLKTGAWASGNFEKVVS
jgi:hypothetical protein